MENKKLLPFTFKKNVFFVTYRYSKTLNSAKMFYIPTLCETFLGKKSNHFGSLSHHFEIKYMLLIKKIDLFYHKYIVKISFMAMLIGAFHFQIMLAQDLDSCFINDNYAIKERFFDAEKMASYKEQEAFNYDKLSPKPNPIEQFLFWLSQKIDDALGSKTSENIWFFLKYILILIALYIVLKTFL